MAGLVLLRATSVGKATMGQESSTFKMLAGEIGADDLRSYVAGG
jgi:hypothetical protein